MISEHISQMFWYDIRYDIKYDIRYDIIHDGKVSAPTAENALHRALSKSRSAAPARRVRRVSRTPPLHNTVEAGPQAEPMLTRSSPRCLRCMTPLLCCKPAHHDAASLRSRLAACHKIGGDGNQPYASAASCPGARPRPHS